MVDMYRNVVRELIRAKVGHITVPANLPVIENNFSKFQQDET